MVGRHRMAVHVWYADVTSLLDPVRERRAFLQLPGHRRDKAERIRSALQRAQSIGVWHVWEALREAHGLSKCAVHNFSHSDRYVMVAACEARQMHRSGSDEPILVGCDIERSRKYNERLAARALTRSEYGRIRDLPLFQRGDRFVRYWVLKESVMKATRCGLSLDPSCIEMTEDGAGQLHFLKAEGIERSLFVYELDVPFPDMCAGLCTSFPNADINVHVHRF